MLNVMMVPIGLYAVLYDDRAGCSKTQGSSKEDLVGLYTVSRKI